MIALPCPFCGSPAYIIRRAGAGHCAKNIHYCFDVGCENTDCFLSDGADWWFDTEEEAINKWNMRGRTDVS